MMPPNPIRMFSTCAPSNKVDHDSYMDHVVRVAQWSEAAGCEGILIYTDNGLVEPWLLAQIVVENTNTICPLVAVQPIYMHPYWVAKMISTIGYLYGRRCWINMVAGGFKNDLAQLRDDTPHDRRYDRVVEYATIVRRLLDGEGPVTFDGDFYRVDKLRMAPPLAPELRPGITISGSSDAGLEAARRLGAIAIQYPRPVHEYEQEPPVADLSLGMRIGVISRHDAGEAWRVARERFPADRTGQLAHQLAMKVSDSAWHRQLSELGTHAKSAPESPYWLHPFENYKTFCPYLVGSHETIAAELARYRRVGYETFVLDVPESPEELEHIGEAFRLAARVE